MEENRISDLLEKVYRGNREERKEAMRELYRILPYERFNTLLNHFWSIKIRKLARSVLLEDYLNRLEKEKIRVFDVMIKRG